RGMKSLGMRRWIVFSMAASVGCGAASPSARVKPAPAAGGGEPHEIADREPPWSDADAPIPVTSEDPVWGSRTAPVTSFVFWFYECPSCPLFARTPEEFRAAYAPAKLRIVGKNEPLDFHANARPAAEAGMGVLALAGNDAFWRFTETAFAHQNAL